MDSNNHDNDTKRLTVKQDRVLIRPRWHSKRFVVAHITGPEAASNTERPPVNLGFVIDRSGSMANGRLTLALQAVEEAIRRLKPQDRFSVVVYDDMVDIVVPGTMAKADAKGSAIERVRTVRPGGMTNLSGGWLKGCEHVATELMADGVNRVLLLTDGLANQGMTDPAELATHAAELRKRGVSTSTFGVGDSFNEVLLGGMAQAGGGQFYDIATAEQIRDHIESEVGETLEVVARSVTLVYRMGLQAFPGGVVISGARSGGGRTMIDLGDLVSGQELDIPLRLSFPFGEIGASAPAMFGLTDRDGVFEGATDRLAWEYADDRANDEQRRDREVDRVIAGIYAARARREAVDLNRRGEFQRAGATLKSTAKKIRAYASDDPELQSIAAELMREADHFEHAMPERTRKEHYAMSSHRMRSRDPEGKARKRAGV